MTIVQPPTYIAAGCYTAQQFRALQDSAAGHQPNVVTGLTLTGVSGRALTFSAGSAVVEGASVAEGYYQVLVSAAETVTVGVGNPTNPRIDRIVVRVKTTEFGDATNTGSIEVVAGTPAASPVAPTPGFSRYLTLATVYVAAAATTLTSANVTQLQINNRNVSLCTSVGRPSAPTKGQPIYETDTNKFLTYQTATTGWTLPWNMPWGRVASTLLNTFANPFTDTVQTTLPGATVTFTAVENRLYKFSYYTSWGGAAVPLTVSVYSYLNGTNFFASQNNFGAGQYGPVAQTFLVACAAGSPVSPTQFAPGSTNFNLAGTLSSSGSILANLSGAYPWFLYVEDIGPNGSPA